MYNTTKPAFYAENLSLPNVAILKCNYYQGVSFWDYQVTQQSFWLLMRNRQEGGALIIQNQKISMHPEYFYLIPPFTSYKTVKEVHAFDQFYVQFVTGKTLGRVPSELITLPARETSEQFFPDFENSAQLAETDFVNLKFYAVIFAALSRLFQRENFFTAEPWVDTRILGLIEIINADPAKKHPNAFLSRKAGMSENNFLRIFRREVGVTPQHYIVQQRIHIAMQMLVETNDSLETIAQRCGFADRYHFSKTFRKITGKTPASFRRQAQRRD